METHYIDCSCGSFKDVLQVSFDVDWEHKQHSAWFLSYALYKTEASLWHRIKFIFTRKAPMWVHGNHVFGVDQARHLRTLLDNFLDKTEKD